MTPVFKRIFIGRSYWHRALLQNILSKNLYVISGAKKWLTEQYIIEYSTLAHLSYLLRLVPSGSDYLYKRPILTLKIWKCEVPYGSHPVHCALQVYTDLERVAGDCAEEFGRQNSVRMHPTDHLQ
jgi:hypothetical protein